MDDLWTRAPLTHEDITAYSDVQQMRLRAELDETYALRCIYGEKLYFVEHNRALAPGHCYSDLGAREAQSISGCCEFHFDMLFMEEDQ